MRSAYADDPQTALEQRAQQVKFDRLTEDEKKKIREALNLCGVPDAEKRLLAEAFVNAIRDCQRDF